MPSALLFNPLNSERSNKQLEDATQQFSVLNVPFQQVPLELNTVMKITNPENDNDTMSSTLQKKKYTTFARNEDSFARSSERAKYIARANAVLTCFLVDDTGYNENGLREKIAAESRTIYR